MDNSGVYTIYNKKEKKKQFNIFKTLYNMIYFSLQGFKVAYKEERSLLIHTTFVSIQIVLGIFFQISLIEWLFVLIVVTLTIGAELVNTAIENVVDLVTENYHPLAKNAKDVGSAFVLLMGTTALIVGLAIFTPKVLEFLHII